MKRKYDFDFVYYLPIVLLFVFVVTFIMTSSFLVFAQDIVNDTGVMITNESIPDIDRFWVALIESNWPLAVGIGLTVIVWAFRNFIIKKIPKKALPWVSLGLAIAGTTGTRLATYSGPWWHCIIQGVLEGAILGFVSMGIWDSKQAIRKRAKQ